MDFPGLFAGINQALMSPQMLAGAGLLSGEGIQGAAAGVQAGTQNLQAQELQRQAAIKQQRDAAWQQQFANGQSPSWAAGLPPSLIQTAALAGPDQGTQLLGQGILHKGDLDAQLKQASAMANLEYNNQMRLLRAQQDLKLQNYRAFMGMPGSAPAAPPSGPAAVPAAPAGGPQASPAPSQPPQQMGGVSAPMDPRQVAAGVASGLIAPEAGKMMIDGDEQSKVASRARVATQLGMDPNDPITKQYLLTGSYPKQEKNWPAIQKADENVAELNNSIDVASDALDKNKTAYSGFGAGTRSMVGGWIGLQGAKDTQDYESDIKLLSGQLAKAIGGSRPTAFEQKLLADSQGSVSQPASVRADIVTRMKTALQRRLDVAQKQSEELRNGTYYRPGNTGSSPNRTFNWDPQKGLTEAPQ